LTKIKERRKKAQLTTIRPLNMKEGSKEEWKQKRETGRETGREGRGKTAAHTQWMKDRRAIRL